MRNVENRIKLKNCEINICNFDHISRLITKAGTVFRKGLINLQKCDLIVTEIALSS